MPSFKRPPGAWGNRGSEIKGLAQLQRTIADYRNIAADDEVRQIISGAAVDLRNAIGTGMRSMNVPSRARIPFATAAKPHGKSFIDKKTHVSALVGLRKRGRSRPYAPGYAEWNPGKRRRFGFLKTAKRSKQLVIPGTPRIFGNSRAGLQKVGESLATMWELGTNLMAAKPFMKQAIEGIKATLVGNMTMRLKDVLARIGTMRRAA